MDWYEKDGMHITLRVKAVGMEVHQLLSSEDSQFGMTSFRSFGRGRCGIMLCVGRLRRRRWRSGGLRERSDRDETTT
jgi:hypothetical protein